MKIGRFIYLKFFVFQFVNIVIMTGLVSFFQVEQVYFEKIK